MENDAPHSVGLLWTSDQPEADNTQHSQETNIHAHGGFRTHNSHSLDLAAIGIGTIREIAAYIARGM
jgi:hypothetical protein